MFLRDRLFPIFIVNVTSVKMTNLGNSSSVQEMIEEAVIRGMERGVREATGVSRLGNGFMVK